MHIESPAMLSVDGVIQPDFMPQSEERWVELGLNGKRGGQKESVTLKELKIVIRYHGLVQYDHDYRLPDKPRWYVGRQEEAVFWHVFDDSWEKDEKIIQIKPGLNIYLCSRDWGGFTRGNKSGGMSYGHTDVDVEILSKLKLLKTDEHYKEELKLLEQQLGEKLHDYVVRSNWVEWLTIKFSLGRRNPSFMVPEPQWTMETVHMLLPSIRHELEAGWNEGLADRQQEAQKVLDYVGRLQRKDFDPRSGIVKLTKMFWNLWPWYSHIHGALHEGLRQEIIKSLQNVTRE